MLSTYEEHQSQPMSLTFEEMASLHREMATEVGKNPDALSLYEDLLALAIKYADVRAHWTLWDREKKREEDPARTSRHNQVIIAFDTLARYLRMQGKAASWRDNIEEESENPYYRKRIGDFACYLAFMEGLWQGDGPSPSGRTGWNGRDY